MKKLLLSFTLLVCGFSTFAQTVPLTKNWEISPVASGGIIISGSNTPTTVAYNPVEKTLYVPERNNKINILNPATGALKSPSTLATSASWLESYKYTKIRVTSDGVIYAVNMTLGSGTLYIYRWASETDPTPIRSSISVAARTGDSFAVSGTGVNTVLYISGAGNNKIYVCKTTDGINFNDANTTTINLTAASDARSSISVQDATNLWINTLNVEAKKITFDASGAITATKSIPTATISQLYGNAEYFVDGASSFLAISGANNSTVGLDLKIYNITNVNAPVLTSSGVLAPSAYTANASAYADIAYTKNGDGTHTFFNLIGGNGLASYTTIGTLPVSLTSFSAALVKGQSTLSWETASETNNKGFEVLRSTNGKEFTKIDFVNAKSQNGNSATALSYAYTDRSAKAGVNYYQLNQVDLDGKTQLLKEVVSVDVSLSGAEVVVFPNPATTYVSVSAGSTDYKGVKYELFDASGKKILSEKATAEQQDISLSKLPASVYFLKISKNGTVQKTVKLVKQ